MPLTVSSYAAEVLDNAAEDLRGAMHEALVGATEFCRAIPISPANRQQILRSLSLTAYAAARDWAATQVARFESPAGPKLSKSLDPLPHARD